MVSLKRAVYALTEKPYNDGVIPSPVTYISFISRAQIDCLCRKNFAGWKREIRYQIENYKKIVNGRGHFFLASDAVSPPKNWENMRSRKERQFEAGGLLL